MTFQIRPSATQHPVITLHSSGAGAAVHFCALSGGQEDVPSTPMSCKLGMPFCFSDYSRVLLSESKGVYSVLFPFPFISVCGVVYLLIFGIHVLCQVCFR